MTGWHDLAYVIGCPATAVPQSLLALNQVLRCVVLAVVKLCSTVAISAILSVTARACTCDGAMSAQAVKQQLKALQADNEGRAPSKPQQVNPGVLVGDDWRCR